MDFIHRGGIQERKRAKPKLEKVRMKGISREKRMCSKQKGKPDDNLILAFRIFPEWSSKMAPTERGVSTRIAGPVASDALIGIGVSGSDVFGQRFDTRPHFTPQ
jgi:hypothetical protein